MKIKGRKMKEVNEIQKQIIFCPNYLSEEEQQALLVLQNVKKSIKQKKIN